MVFAPKYWGKMLVGDVAMICEGIICKRCVEMDIRVIEIAVNPDHIHIFFKYPPKYFELHRKKDKSSFEKNFKEGISSSSGMVWRSSLAPSCFHGSVGNGWDVVEKYIREQDVYEYNREK